jgi:HK97 family phage prohead protease
MRVTVPVGNEHHQLDLQPAGNRDGRRVWTARCRLPMQGLLGGGLQVVRDAPKATGAAVREAMPGSADTASGPVLLEGYASSTSRDWHGTEMTREALDSMARQMAAGVPYVPSHMDDEWEQVMGRTVEARVEHGTIMREGGTGTQADGYRLAVRVELYTEHPRSQQLMQAVKRGQVVGMSIGGWFTDAEVETNENDEVERIYIKAVELDHLAVTRRPSNPDSWIAGLARSTGAALAAARIEGAPAFLGGAVQGMDNRGMNVNISVCQHKNEAEMEYEAGEEAEAVEAAEGSDATGYSCPVATQDIPTNLANRQHAIDRAGYGPANPENPGNFWEQKAKLWQATVAEARSMVCGNCSLFNTTTNMQGCITQGIGGPDAAEVEREGALGFCEAFDFKCSAKRTCAAWVVGGPFDDAKAEASGTSEGEAMPYSEAMGDGMEGGEAEAEAEAGERGTFMDAPNYRLSNVQTEVCNRCEHYTRDGWCSKFNFAAGHEYVCDAFMEGTIDHIMAGGNHGHSPATQGEADAENAERAVSGNTDLPLAPEDTAWGWDTDAANEVLGDPPDWERYGMAHLWMDTAAPERRASYKLPFAKMVQGELHIVFRGVAAAMGALNGARGGVDMPDSDRPKVYERITALYQRFDKEPPELLRAGDTALDNAGVQGSTATSQSDAVESAALQPPSSEDNAMTDNRSTATDTQRMDNMERAIGDLHGVLSKLVERVAPTATNNTAPVADEAAQLRAQLEAKDAQLTRALAAASRQGVAHSPHANRHTDVGGHGTLIRTVERTLGGGSALVQIARSQAERRDSTTLQTRAQLEADLRSLLAAAFADGIITDSMEG